MSDERLDSLERTRSEQEGIEAEFKRHETRWKSDMDRKVDSLVAFAEKYKDYLELCIEREQEKKRLRGVLLEHSLKGLMWGGIVAVGAALWSYAKINLK